jgi:hypothetical protein
MCKHSHQQMVNLTISKLEDHPYGAPNMMALVFNDKHGICSWL